MSFQSPNLWAPQPVPQPVQPQAASVIPPREVTAPPNPNGYIRFGELEQRVLENITDDNWFWKSVLPRGGIAMVVGQPMTGKSLLMHVLVAASQASEEDHAKIADRVVTDSNVLYLHLEHNSQTLVSSMRASARARNASLDDVIVKESLDLDDISAVEELLRVADERQIDVIFIDSLRQAMSGDENSANDMAELARRLKPLTNDGKRLVVLVHHTTKSGDSPRGSSQLMGMVDTLVTLTSHGKRIKVTAKNRLSADQEFMIEFRQQGEGNTATLDVVEVDASSDTHGGLSDEEMVSRVVDCVRRQHGLSSTELDDRLKEETGVRRNGSWGPARARAEEQGLIVCRREGSTNRWFPPAAGA